ncbi:MAG: hypothetical protein HQ567_12480 [Candidatus Nealsonbacteria bacterium]|nr:hypothetical protein [Candidatus Nealsonbacteria bacterium]
MSIDYTTSLLVPAEMVAEQFVYLLRRLELRGEVEYSELFDRALGEKERNLSAADTHRLDFVQQVVDSDRCMELEMAFTLKSGRQTDLQLQLRGRNYSRGTRIAMEGPITVSVPGRAFQSAAHRQAAREWLQSLSEGRPKSQTGFLEQAPDHIISAGEVVFRDAKDLFLTIAGWGTAETKEVSHLAAAMFEELDWPIPMNCFMALHSDAREFCRDLARIYARYHWGISTPRMHGGEFSLTAAERQKLDFEEPYSATLEDILPLAEDERSPWQIDYEGEYELRLQPPPRATLHRAVYLQ